MRRNIPGFVVATALVTSGAALADPTVDQLIKSLTPSAKSLSSHTGRGISADLPDTPDTPPATEPSSHAARAPAHHASSGLAATDLVVHFASGSADLTPQATATLDRLGEALTSPTLAGYRFRIEGHTDTVGTDEANRALSTSRAEAVTDYLERKYHVAPGRLEAVGLGKEGLAVPTPDQTPEARNRRVHIVNLGA